MRLVKYSITKLEPALRRTVTGARTSPVAVVCRSGRVRLKEVRLRLGEVEAKLGEEGVQIIENLYLSFFVFTGTQMTRPDGAMVHPMAHYLGVFLKGVQ